MKQFFRDLISESSDLSMMRFLSLITVLAAIGMAIYGLNKGTDLSGLAMLSGTFLATGIGGKVVQSFGENKTEEKTDDSK